MEKVLAAGRDWGSGRGVSEGPEPDSREADALGASSESGLSEESSSPEGGALWVGFERNQLNQPKPELFPRRAAFGGDVLSVSSEDSSSSVADTVEFSEMFRALGVSGTCGLEATV